ncbi:hypothetical protein GF367_02910 [Candidatus Woesearchaeota archaeon]|nr:hypothetical protein [Candidatus Woesearchaeota archaeon]
MNDKRGVELSFNLIIVAIVALLVLVVVVYLIANQSGNVRQGTLCVKHGGRCVEKLADCSTYQIQNTDATKPLCKPGVCCSLVPKE